MATQMQHDGDRAPSGRRWPGPPVSGTSARLGPRNRNRQAGPQPPPRRRPAQRPGRGPEHAPPVPARRPKPLPEVHDPAAFERFGAIIDLRLSAVEIPVLVGPRSEAMHATPDGISTLDVRSSLPRYIGENLEHAHSPSTIDETTGRPAPLGLVEPDAVVEPIDAETERRVWPEIRFYLGAAALFFVTFAFVTGLWVFAPKLILGWNAAAITSGSMEPSIQVGDVVVFDDGADKPIVRNSVIVFEDAQGSLVTHRVVTTLDDGTYVTRGDANTVNDSAPVHAESIQGVGRLLVPFAGFPAVWTSSGT